MKIAIVIPARIGSTRLPRKPLLNLAGKKLVEHVADIALKVKNQIKNYDIDVIVTSDSDEVLSAINSQEVILSLTTEDCLTGSDRVYLAIKDKNYDYVINLQGDAPFINPNWIVKMINDLSSTDLNYVSTLGIRLNAVDTNDLIEYKKLSNTSGTTVTMNSSTGMAYWFSKAVIPNIRNGITDNKVIRHVGIYGYPIQLLHTFYKLEPSFYELIEGLEQLRLLENGISVKVIEVEKGLEDPFLSIDTKMDLELANEVLSNATYCS